MHIDTHTQLPWHILLAKNYSCKQILVNPCYATNWGNQGTQHHEILPIASRNDLLISLAFRKSTYLWL